MSEPIRDQRPVAPNPRLRPAASNAGHDQGYFFPGEVARLLDLEDVDYHQLRRLLRLVRQQAAALPPPRGKWSRYTLRDVAALQVAVEVCGGRAALVAGRHLKIAPLERACAALRRQGVSNPLLDVPLTAHGRRVFALVDGTLVDPTSGQQALADGLERLDAYLGADYPEADLRERLRQESSHAADAKAAPRTKGESPL